MCRAIKELVDSTVSAPDEKRDLVIDGYEEIKPLILNQNRHS